MAKPQSKAEAIRRQRFQTNVLAWAAVVVMAGFGTYFYLTKAEPRVVWAFVLAVAVTIPMTLWQNHKYTKELRDLGDE